VLIGGPFPARAYGLVIPAIQAALDPLTIAPAARDYVVELGALRGDASLTGALWLGLERRRVDYLLRRAALELSSTDPPPAETPLPAASPSPTPPAVNEPMAANGPDSRRSRPVRRTSAV